MKCYLVTYLHNYGSSSAIVFADDKDHLKELCNKDETIWAMDDVLEVPLDSKSGTVIHPSYT